MLVGFIKEGKGHLRRGGVTVEFKMGYEPHWWINTPGGSKQYGSQGQALHALVLYRMITRQDLEKMAGFGFNQAKKELETYGKTAERAVTISRSLDRRKHHGET